MKKMTMIQFRKEAEIVLKALINIRISNRTKRILIFTFLFMFNVNMMTPGAMSEDQTIQPHKVELTKEQLYVQTVKQKMRTELINEVDMYIMSIAPTSKLSPSTLVDKCLEYETDIVFVLAQALLESHFGTKGMAKETNSVWNVGTYDNGQILYTFGDPNQSIDPYLKLINEKYFITVTAKGDTIRKELHQIVQDGSYVNYQNKRFASARNYENGLRKLMITIDMKTSISFYQDVLRLHDEELLALFNPEPIKINPTELLAQY